METSKKQWVWVTFQRPGYHFYSEAGTRPDLQDVKYLAATHRHLFKFKLKLQVFHDDREVEFHQLLNYCESLFDKTININRQSVEMLANTLYTEVCKKYPNRDMIIDVSEDGECGASVEFYHSN